MSKVALDALCPRQQAFVQEYVRTMNGVQSAIKSGYSKKGADVQACMMLKLPKVKRYINILKRQCAERASITAEYVLTEIKQVLESAKNDKDYRSILKAAELLGKHLKLFTEVHEVNGTITHMGYVTLVDKTGKKAPLMIAVGKPANPHPQLQ